MNKKAVFSCHILYRESDCDARDDAMKAKAGILKKSDMNPAPKCCSAFVESHTCTSLHISAMQSHL